MSFRQRFVLIIALAIVTVIAASLAFVQLREQGNAAREAAAIDRAVALTEELTREANARALDEATLRADDARAPWLAIVDARIAPFVDASAGFCARDGTLLLARSAVPPHAFRGTREWLLPADRDTAMAACREAGASAAVASTRAALPRDVLFASAQSCGSGVVAWAMTRIAPRSAESEPRSLAIEIAAMSLASLFLVFLTVDALFALRGGARDLETTLLRLQDDLRAAIPRPRANELGRIAAGLHTMAAHLADARDRERALARQLAHEQRLAGLGRVVAGVAHEVRNPITGIKLKLDGLARRGLDARSSDDVSTCLQEIARLDRVVSSLLMVARKAPSERERLALDALVDERLAQAEALAAPGAVRLRRLGGAEVVANREVLARVLDNLIRNAIEASPASAEVTVRIERSEAGARIRVIDEGAGIPADREGELFEPFFTLKSEGTGLGLFLSRSLMRALGGDVTYERASTSTVFTVNVS